MSDGATPPPETDVRMRGFRTLAPVRDFLAASARVVDPAVEESVPVAAACGRVLAGPVVAPVNVPSFRRAAMDGYAVRAADAPGPLAVVGEAKPGRPFAGRLDLAQAVRVMTGAPVPDGADAVAPVEQCRATAAAVTILAPVSAGKHVMAVGEDMAQGTEALPRFRVLRPQDIALLASLGLAAVSVVAKPRVKLLMTGGELLPPGAPPAGFQTADSNSVMLRAFVARDGGAVTAAAHAPDDPARLRAEMAAGEWDVLLVSGGTSVGVDDHAPAALRGLAGRFVHGFGMKPGMPAGHGFFADGREAFLLPGNPAACLVAYDLLARPALRRRGGHPPGWPYPEWPVTLTAPVPSQLGRLDYVRLHIDRAAKTAMPVRRSGAANLSGTVHADGFLLVDADVERLDAGAVVQAFLYDR